MAFGAHQYHQTPLWVAAENDTIPPSEIQVQVLSGNTKAQARWESISLLRSCLFLCLNGKCKACRCRGHLVIRGTASPAHIE